MGSFCRQAKETSQGPPETAYGSAVRRRLYGPVNPGALAEPLPGGRGARLVVVCHAAQLERAALGEQRVGAAVVAVHRLADATRIDELDAVWADASKLDMGVAEHNVRFADAFEQLVLVVGGVWQERAHVRDRGGVAVAGAVKHRLFIERAELLHRLRIHRGSAVGDRLPDQLVVGRPVGVCRPAIDVAADPSGATQLP